MTAQTPVFGIEYLTVGEPARNTRAALENNAHTIEAALIAGPASPPGASDLLAVSGRVSVLEARPQIKRGGATVTTNSAGYFVVTHGLGVTPVAVFVQGRHTTNAYDITVSEQTSTTFTARIMNNGTAVVSTAVPVFWIVTD